MNPIEAVVRRVDKTQQRHNAPGFVFGIIKKFGDDNAGVLVTNLAYAGFVSLFPLLLILTTILGLVASADPALRERALDAVAKQVPLIGQQLTGSVHELRQSSIIGLIVGVVVLLWGTTRLAQAGIFTMEQVWNLPGPARVGLLPPAAPVPAVPGRAGPGRRGHDDAHRPGGLQPSARADDRGGDHPGHDHQRRDVPDRVPGADAGQHPAPAAVARLHRGRHHLDRAADGRHPAGAPRAAQRRGVRRVRDRARPAGLGVPGRGGRGLRGRAQRGRWPGGCGRGPWCSRR